MVDIVAPNPYSEPTKLIPLITSGAAPRFVVIKSTFSILLVYKPIDRPVMTNVKVIKIAGFNKDCNSAKESLARLVPITVQIAISNNVLVPIGHSVVLILPLMFNKPALIKAPVRGAARLAFLRV